MHPSIMGCRPHPPPCVIHVSQRSHSIYAASTHRERGWQAPPRASSASKLKTWPNSAQHFGANLTPAHIISDPGKTLVYCFHGHCRPLPEPNQVVLPSDHSQRRAFMTGYILCTTEVRRSAGSYSLVSSPVAPPCGASGIAPAPFVRAVGAADHSIHTRRHRAYVVRGGRYLNTMETGRRNAAVVGLWIRFRHTFRHMVTKVGQLWGQHHPCLSVQIHGVWSAAVPHCHGHGRATRA